ncbi:MAG: SDR family NAD(P)-dependent oxidoreductase [Pseudohongiellaceae bacterium]
MSAEVVPAQDDTALVIGAGSHIARAVIEELLAGGVRVIAVSRRVDRERVRQKASGLVWLQADYSEASIARICAGLKDEGVHLDRVFICHGVLHDETVSPEKRLDDISEAAFAHVFRVNAWLPLLWLKHLAPLLPRRSPCVVTVFSARVGSIADNRQGGWYAYRGSKAALNMLLKTAAIELRRTHRHLRVLAFHPGTTDTPLSAPFQTAVPEGRLFTPTFVAQRLLDLVADLPGTEAIQFLDWDGKRIDW